MTAALGVALPAVPAVAALIGRANWWPAKPRKAARVRKAVDAHAG